MYINITDKKEAQNKGSSGKLVHYLEKENRTENRNEPEHWFNGQRKDIEAKFFLINISPSQKELAYLKEQYGDTGMGEQLKRYTEKVMDEYARNFRRDGINSNSDLLWFAKVEDNRYYSHKDEEVKQGLKKRGDRKEGMQRHIQVIVSRKDITGRYKLSPMNSSRGRNVEHSKKMGQFDRVAFKQSGETVFDREFEFDRGLKETFAHANVQKNGDIGQRQQMDLLIDSEKETALDRSFINDLANEVSKNTYDNSTGLLEVITKGMGGLLGTLLEPSPPGIDIVPEQEPRKKKKRKRRNYG